MIFCVEMCRIKTPSRWDLCGSALHQTQKYCAVIDVLCTKISPDFSNEEVKSPANFSNRCSNFFQWMHRLIQWVPSQSIRGSTGPQQRDSWYQHQRNEGGSRRVLTHLNESTHKSAAPTGCHALNRC